jgi:DNA polymerase kappa
MVIANSILQLYIKSRKMTSRFNDNKAGMESIDKSRIQRIIEESTSQNYGNYEQKQAKRMEERVHRNLQLLAEITEGQIEKAQNEVN